MEHHVVLRLLSIFKDYEKNGHSVRRGREQEVLRDFVGFYYTAEKLGLRGIRWNFNGCIACRKQVAPVRLRRVLLVDAEIIEATGGRALATEICQKHEPAIDTEAGHAEILVPGALERIKRDPPRPSDDAFGV